MEQQHLTRQPERMSPQEAEEVLRRFREEEELRQREMEAQATNPTVADLAEGLGVPQDRIASLLAQVRNENVPPPFKSSVMTVGEAQAEVSRSNKNAWGIAIAVLVGALFMFMLVAMLLFSSTSVETAPGAPVTVETTTPSGSPTTDASAPVPTAER